MLMYIYWLRFLDHTAYNHITAIGLTLVARLVCVGPKSSYFNMLLNTSSPLNTCKQSRLYFSYTFFSHFYFISIYYFGNNIYMYIYTFIYMCVYLYIYKYIYKLSLSFLYFMLLYISTIQRILPIETYRQIITKKSITPQYIYEN